MDRLSGDEPLVVLAKLVQDVPEDLKRKVLCAVLTTMLTKLKVPEALAAAVAQAICCNLDALVPLLQQPEELPSVLKKWAESDAAEAAFSELSQCVRDYFRPLAEERFSAGGEMREVTTKAVNSLNVRREHFEKLVDGDMEGLLKLVTSDVAVQAVAKLLQTLGMEPDKASAAAEALKPSEEQMERLDDEGLAVLGEMVGGVPHDIQEQILTTVLVKLLTKLRLPETLASDIAQAVRLDSDELLPCLSDSDLLPEVLKGWAESDESAAALADLSESVQKVLRELAEDQIGNE